MKVYIIWFENKQDIDAPFMMSVHASKEGAKEEFDRLTDLMIGPIWVREYKLKK